MIVNSQYYKIADLNIKLSFENTKYSPDCLLPSFKPFFQDTVNGDLFFECTVNDELQPVSKEKRERIRTFETGNGDTIVDQLKDGGYQYIIKDINGNECALLIANKNFDQCNCALKGNYNMRCYGLNNVLMLIFAFAGSRHQTVLMHASLVRENDYGYAFIAKSGVGKSTQVSMWLRYIPGCDLMNDDNPVIRIIEGKPYIYGSPWSGKTPCYRNVKAKLGAVTRIRHAQQNSIEQLKAIEAFASVLPSCSIMKWDEDIFTRICMIVSKIVETTNIYTLHCLPNQEAAVICHQNITKSKK